MTSGKGKTILFCDSGVGGADLAATFIAALRSGAAFPEIGVVLFNAWLRPGEGFNQLPSMPEKIRALEAVTKGVSAIGADRVVFACNTISTIWHEAPALRRSAGFFPAEMLVPAADFLAGKWQESPGSDVLIAGTATTVETALYPAMLAARGVPPGKIRSVPCPGLATQIEYAPDGPRVRTMIVECAHRAAASFSRAPRRLLLALCCTHFGYATAWKEIFSDFFDDVEVLNPNAAAVASFLGEWKGGFSPRISVEFRTRVEFPAFKAEALASALGNRAPEVVRALFSPRRDPALFNF